MIMGLPFLRVRVSGFRYQHSRGPKKTAGLIEKETQKKRISNNECRRNVFYLFKIKEWGGDPAFRHS